MACVRGAWARCALRGGSMSVARPCRAAAHGLAAARCPLRPLRRAPTACPWGTLSHPRRVHALFYVQGQAVLFVRGLGLAAAQIAAAVQFAPNSCRCCEGREA